MRKYKEVENTPKWGDARLVTKFVLFPKTLKLKSGGQETRCFENCDIVQTAQRVAHLEARCVWFEEEFVDEYWKEDSYDIKNYFFDVRPPSPRNLFL
jgi:hypothetical protein